MMPEGSHNDSKWLEAVPGAGLAVGGSSGIPAPLWAVGALGAWAAVVALRGWAALTPWDKRQLVWAVSSIAAFLVYLQLDPEFRGWGDVYFFCGSKLQYCTCVALPCLMA